MTTLSLILVAILWGGFFVVGTLSVHAAPPLTVGAWRFLVATPLFLLLLLPRWKEERLPTWRDLPILAGMGATGIVAYNWLSFEAMQRAGAADGAMITPALHPLITLLVAGWLFAEPLTFPKIVGVLLAIGGEGLVFHEALSAVSTHPDRLMGDVYYLLAAFCWSAYTLLGRAASRRFSALATSFYSSLLGTLMVLPLAGPSLGRIPSGPGAWTFWLGILYLAVGGTVAAFWLWHRGIAAIGASRAATFSYLVPLSALALSALFLHDHPSPIQLAGTALVLGGVLLANWQGMRQAFTRQPA